MKNITQSLSRSFIGASLLAQLIYSSFACAQVAKLPGNLSSPEAGVICNDQAKVCYDFMGVSIGITRDVMGDSAADKLTRELSAVDEKYFDRSNFNPVQGISCHTLEKLCYEEERASDLLSATLFGTNAGSYGPDVLIDVPWAWSGSQYNNDSAIVAKDGRSYTLEFLQGGSLRIQADCNKVGGSYQVKGKSLTIKTGPSTMMACAPDTQDAQFLRDLTGVAGWFLKKGDLYLDMKVDTGTLTFYRCVAKH